MKKSIYLDTTIPSYYFDERLEIKLHVDLTRRWWNEERELYNLYVSELVMEELTTGEYPYQPEIIQLVADLARLAIVSEIEEIIEVYLKNRLMPHKDIGDAFHLALASYYKIDYLLTWNCQHLANVNKQEHIRVINTLIGLHTPEIITPLEIFVEKGD
ncbi:MAG: PIN domain-containing protein [bacterium]|nr:PIN domain-containing protein [bacterium]